MAKQAKLISLPNRSPPNLLDWSTVEGEINSRICETTNRQAAFLTFALETLFDLSSTEISRWITEGGNDRGVDAIVVDEQRRSIHILSSKCVSSSAKTAHNFPAGEVDKTLTFIGELLEKCDSLLACNETLTAAVKEIWARLEDGGYSVHVHLCSNRAPLTKCDAERVGLSLATRHVRLHEHALRDFAAGGTKAHLFVRRRLNFEPSTKVERTFGSIRTVTGYVTAVELASFLSDATGNLDTSLFHGNVRGFLGAKSQINEEIAGSLASADRCLFACFNNGIKITCDRLISTVGSFPANLDNPQVVNGLQTATVVFAFATAAPREAEDASVLVQVSETKDTKVATKIALASNNQQRIGTRDLRANDPLQIQLERELKKRGYAYIRKQGEAGMAHSTQIIDALRLGQIILAYVLHLPDKAKTQSQAIFGDMYGEVFNPCSLTAERVIALHALYRLIEDKKLFAKTLQRRVSGNGYAEEWIIEGIFHVLFAIKLLCDASGIDPFEFDSAKRVIDRAIEIVDGCFVEADSSAYRFFRLVATRIAIEQAVLSTLLRPIPHPNQLEFGFPVQAKHPNRVARRR